MGSGVCVLDYDNDGWQDILFVNSMDWPGHGTSKSYPALYHNKETEPSRTGPRRPALASRCMAWGVLSATTTTTARRTSISPPSDRNHLFHNLGNGRFVDVTARAEWRQRILNRRSMVRLRQRWQTRSVCRALRRVVACCRSDMRTRREAQILLHARGLQGPECEAVPQPRQTGFENVTRAGLSDPTSKSLGIALIDHDNDGWLDLFVTNDTQPNKLYRNNHNGTFTESAVQRVWPTATRARRGPAWASITATTTTRASRA